MEYLKKLMILYRISYHQTAIGSFTGVYEIPPEGVKIDYDHGFILPNLDKTGFRSFKDSLLKWTLIPFLLLIVSLIVFERRDVH